MAPIRSQGRKEQFAAMKAQRHQDGGPGPSTLPQDASTADYLELQKAKAAQNAAETVLEKTEVQLDAQIDHSKNLYRALPMERQKVSRTKAAKAQAQECATEAQS